VSNAGVSRSPVLLAILLGTTTGCSAYLAASPRIYATGAENPYPAVVPELRTADVPLLYATDRGAKEGSTESNRAYTWERDRSLAFGIAHVRFGLSMSWEELVKATQTSTRSDPVLITLDNVEERGRIPETTYEYSRTEGRVETTPTRAESVELADRLLLQMVESRLALAPRKDIFLFVHGYANTFQDAAFTLAQVWHFLGREGVPFLYSWPAGSGGLLRGYTHDRESGEFTIFHLKHTLRLLAKAKGLGKIHVIAHSRGTDVFLTALRELFLQDGRRIQGDCIAERLGTVVLAAPDIDFDVLTSRVLYEGLPFVPDRLTIYVSEGDRAIGISDWLFSSLKRVGQLQSADVSPEALERLRQYSHVEVIDARVSGYGSWGHDYFYANPAVSSDLIRLLRDGKAAGDVQFRPLRREENSFWILENDYPQPPEKK
jgi:esterase/lipase superfamily enzyme